MDPDALAKAFVEHYYSTFDTNRNNLANLYQEGSMLSFEGQKIQGSHNIVAKLTSLPFQHYAVAKLTSLPFQQCHHSISTVDCQPSGVNAGMLVFVSGNLQLAGEQHALKFSQMFHLIPTPQGSYYVLNDIFRLNYA
ncbi:Nuclear transport factor 2 [Glycine soja]|nr:Nuclear transport factor 2 [Glycine soja]